MMDRRWVLIDILPCANSITVSGAGTDAVNGIYCPDGTEYGQPVWTKIGGTRLEDSIYWAFYGGEELGYFILTSGGSFEADPLNALYSTFTPPFSAAVVTWDVYGSFGPGGDAPAPRSINYDDKEPIIRNFGCLQPAKFSEEEDLSVGCKELRRKLTSDIVFSGSDFDYFLAIERQASRRCEELTIRRQWKCNGVWKTIWTGVFSTGSGEWDFDKCEFTVRPDVLDEYTCIMRAMNKKVNVLQVGPVDVNAIIISSGIEFGVCIDGVGTNPEQCLSKFGSYGWALAHTWVLLGLTHRLYWREAAFVECVGGVPSPPVGAGWGLFANNCSGAYNSFMADGTAFYTRNPSILYTFGDPIECPVLDPEYPECCPPSVWVNYYDDPDEGGLTDVQEKERIVIPNANPGFRVCLSGGTPIEYVGRTLQATANFMLESAGCDQVEMVSDLLEWNPPGDAPGYAAGIDYVTGLANQRNALVLVQNSDAVNPIATNPATRSEMTLRELFTMLATAMKLFWKIDTLGRVRIEHWSYWTTPVGLNVATYATDDKSEPLAFAHLKSEIPRYERPKWSQAENRDFVGVDIEYSGPCVNNELENDVKEYSAGPFMTDLAFITFDPEAINLQGFTLLATEFDDPLYNVIIDDGVLTGNFITNAPMSWANLERDYWQHDRFLPTGTMNEVLTEFLGFVPNIEQRNVFLKFCCDYVNFNSSERVQTKLGAKLGSINAFIRRAEFDEATDGLTLTLRYAY